MPGGRSLTGLHPLLDCYPHSEWKQLKRILDSKSLEGSFQADLGVFSIAIWTTD